MLSTKQYPEAYLQYLGKYSSGEKGYIDSVFVPIYSWLFPPPLGNIRRVI